MKKCSWRCEHLQCSKLCSEPCDRGICELRDSKLIEVCGHQSIGVCGEEISDLCRICDKEKFEEICIGGTDDEKDRFIELVECEHLIEVNALVQLMKSEPDGLENRVDGAQRKCPKCNTGIRHTKALRTNIQSALNNIQQVKHQIRGDPKTNEILQRNLNRKARNARDILNERIARDTQHDSNDHYEAVQMAFIFTTVMEETARGAKSRQALIALQNKFELTMRVDKIFQNVKNRFNHSLSLRKLKRELIERLRTTVAFIAVFTNADQQRHDILIELSFLELMTDVIIKFNSSRSLLSVDALFEIARKRGAATENIREEFMTAAKGIWQQIAVYGYPVTEPISFKQEAIVLGAMDFTPDNWRKCPNGHIRCIGLHGTAVNADECFDCTSSVGSKKRQNK